LEREAQVTVIVPGGGSILPVTGKYYPAAGGQGVRRAASQVTAEEFDFLVLPDSLNAAQLARYPQILALLREGARDVSVPIPVFTIRYLLHLLDRHVPFQGIARDHQDMLTSGTRVH
jgi:aspartate/methionine/tyrosine aminotransferase